MEPINSDKLINFIYYSVILFGLFMIIYMMYLDYISEKMSNDNSKKLYNKINNNSVIKTDSILNEESNQLTEQFTSINPNLNYIIKRNYSNIEYASCFKNDITDSKNRCYMKASTFYPLQDYKQKSYTISSLPYTILDGNTNKNTYYANIINKKSGKLTPLNGNNGISYRENNFNFSNEKYERNLIENGELETIINDYFTNYITQYNNLNNISNPPVNINYINKLKDILLLKPPTLFNDPNDPNKPNYTIPNINIGIQKLIQMFEKFEKENLDTELSITNNTKLIVLINPETFSKNIKTNLVYSLILKIYISIKIINLTPIDYKNNSSTINSFDSLMTKFDHFIYDKDKSYIYTIDKEILFPIMLNFDNPKRIDQKTVNLNDDKWIENIIQYMKTLYIDNQYLKREKILMENTNKPDSIDKIKGKLEEIKLKDDNDYINNITRIFVIYIPKKNIFDDKEGTFYLKIENNKNKNDILEEYINEYHPNFCTNNNTILFKRKCLPKCPPNYNIDLGLVCLKSKLNKYVPGSKLCIDLSEVYKNKQIEVGSILEGIFQGCNHEYYNNKELDSTDSTDSTTAENSFDIGEDQTANQPEAADDETNKEVDQTANQVNYNEGNLDENPQHEAADDETNNKEDQTANQLNESEAADEESDDQFDSFDNLFTNVIKNNDTKKMNQHFNNIENFELDKSKLSKFNELNNKSNFKLNNVSRKDNKRYEIDSRPITQPIIQNNKQVIHFYPFEN